MTNDPPLDIGTSPSTTGVQRPVARLASPARVQELEQQNAELTRSLERIKAEIRQTREQLETDSSIGPQTKRQARIDVRYVGDDKFQSAAFPSGRCFAHVSPDGTCILIRLKEKGNLAIHDTRVRIPGIATLRPLRESHDIRGFQLDDDEFIIRLT